MELLLKYITVAFFAGFKFLVGIAIGWSVGLGFWETAFFTALGMMLTVLLFSFLGRYIKKNIFDYYFRPRKRFSPRKRRIVRIWKRYGLLGVSFLTPIVLTPIGGTLVSVMFGEKWYRIFLYMLINAIVWSVGLTYFVYFLAESVGFHIGKHAMMLSCPIFLV